MVLGVGDPLRDNLSEVDGYRFHDCIHLAFVAILGWSPVMRDLMKRKRKTNDAVDDVEDGARARIVEEMIVKLAHSYAVGVNKNKLLEGKKRIGFDLLKQIQYLAEGLEVAGGRKHMKAVKYWEWEQAILEGYRVFGDLRFHKEGRLRVDIKNREITFFKLEENEGNFFPFTE